MSFLPRFFVGLGVLSFFPAVLSLSFGFPYGSQKVRGVNLGGWLVLEVPIAPLFFTYIFTWSSPQPWITPSLFDNTGDSRIVDEWTFCQYQDAAVATSVLQTHWNTWITEADFVAIAAAGYISLGSSIARPYPFSC